MNSESSWSSVSTDLLLAELARREATTKTKPQCGSSDRGSYNTPLHIAALALILLVSTLACAFPLFSRRISTSSSPNSLQSKIIFICQHFGTGVLLATGFVHLLPTAFSSLTDPCLPYLFNEGFPPLPGFIAMCAVLTIVTVEMYLSTRGAGHSHSHTHMHADWDSADAEYNKLAAPGAPAAPSRPRDRHLRIASLDSADDAEASESLVAGISPLPGSTPTRASPDHSKHARSGAAARRFSDHDHDDDDDSDLDLDLDEEINDDPIGSVAPHASGSVGYGDMDIQDVPENVAEERRRRFLQCVLLEAGILFHSIFIGMAISVSTGPMFVIFLIAISFHQCFEGLALGSRIAALPFPKRSPRPWFMVLAFGTTTPIGQAIGLLVHGMYDPQSQTGLLMVGIMNAISAGLLLFAGLVQLLSEDFLTEKSYKTLTGARRRNAFLAVVSGAMLMSLTDIFTTGASHMALVHNVILRGFNTVYLQAKRVPAADKAAFVGYAQTWHKFVVSHHNDEEESLFPKISEMLRDENIWVETLEEHESFMQGMRDFSAYLTSLSDAAAFSGSKLMSIMDTFKDAFEQHFHSEIHTIAALHGHANAPVEGSAENAAATALFKTWGKATVSKAGMADAVPFFLMNLDSTAEEGLWANWPPMPAPIKWGLANLVGSYYGSYWKFSSCDSSQMPRELYAINMPEQE